MLCPLCSNELRDTANFCGKCGNKVPRCPTCGRVIARNTRFCGHDGTAVPEEILAAFSAVPAPAAAAAPQQQDGNRPEPVRIKTPKPALPPQQSRRLCTHCGKPINGNGKLCPACQAQLSAAKTASGTSGKPKKKMILLIILLILLTAVLVTAAGLLILKNFTGSRDSDRKETTEVTGEMNEPEEMEEAEETEVTLPTESVDPGASGAAEGTEEDGTAAGDVQASTEATMPPTEAPEPSQPVYVSTYEIIPGDLSWLEAREACEARGGTLASINSSDEYYEICKLADKSGLRYLWLGAFLPSVSAEWSNCTWLTGEPWGFEVWYPNEPSKMDADGTNEFFLCMWLAKYNNEDIGWTFNDQRNDIVADFPNVSGKIGYVCEYVVEVTP